MLISRHDHPTAATRTAWNHVINFVLLAILAVGGAVAAYAPRQPQLDTAPAPVSLRLAYTRASGNAPAAIAYALRQLGTPYRWGGTGNGGFDCSGLVMRAWQAGGVYLPRTSFQMARVGRRVAHYQLHPGDLVFSNNFGHVQLYVGGGRVVEAAHSGTVVRTGPLPYPSRVNAYMRVPGA